MIEAPVVYRHLSAGNHWGEKVAWCKENLYHGGHYEPKWYTMYPYIVFEDEKQYIWFTLRWS